MTPRTVTFLAVATAVAVGAATVSLNIERGYAPQATNELVFPGLIDKVNEVTKIAVDHKDGKIVVVRNADGTWTVPASDNFPANVAQAQKVILQLAGMRLFEAKTAQKDLYNRLHLEELNIKGAQARRVRLFGAKDTPLAELIVGKKKYNLPGPITEGAYVRKPSDPQTWLAKGEITVDPEVKAWLRKSILNIREEDVAAIEIRHPGGEIVKITKENPTARHFTLHGVPEGKRVKYQSDPDNVANVVEDLELVDVRKEGHIEFAADKTIEGTYTSRSGLIAHLSLIKMGEDSWVKVRVEAKPDALAPTKKGEETGQQVAKRLSDQLTGWVFKIPDFKASRLSRGMADMAVDKKAGS
ncbi:MAG: DUF4340 domain-containing protein [Rhodospirillaceae bacterium]|nr:DUF4340 domain-containing protein [Rhodospirillaceae bacterium]